MIKFPFCYIIYWTHILGNMEIEYSGLQNSSPNTRASFESPMYARHIVKVNHMREEKSRKEASTETFSLFSCLQRQAAQTQNLTF